MFVFILQNSRLHIEIALSFFERSTVLLDLWNQSGFNTEQVYHTFLLFDIIRFRYSLFGFPNR